MTIYSDYIRSLYYAGQLDQARVEAEKLRELDPDFARAYYELGLVLEEQGKLDEAIAAFRNGIGGFCSPSQVMLEIVSVPP